MSTSNGFESTEAVAHYLKKLLAYEFGESGEPQMPEWQLDFLEELHYCVKLVSYAIKNKSELNLCIHHIMKKRTGIGNTAWTVHQYMVELTRLGKRCTGMQDRVEGELNDLFPPAATVAIAEPCVIVDSDGIILLWFLPGLLNKKRQVSRLQHV
jgi:hypothetical protein